MPKKVVMTKKKFVKEHENLTSMLDSVSKKLKKESEEQKTELKKVKKGKKK
jgi:hypothetical protein